MAPGLLRTSDVDAFVERYVDSFAAWDILTLYGTSPNRLCDVCDIAELVGRPEALVEESLRTLADKGFFRIEESSGRSFFHFEPSPALADELGGFISATTDRRGRLKALSVLLRRLGPSGAADEAQ